MLAEQLGKHRTGTCKPLAHGIGADSKNLGDLARLHSFDADEQRDLPVGIGQRSERTLDRQLGL